MSPADKTKQFTKEAPLVTDALARHLVKYQDRASTLDAASGCAFNESEVNTLDVLAKGFVEIDIPVK
jgi:hypothetical protein